MPVVQAEEGLDGLVIAGFKLRGRHQRVEAQRFVQSLAQRLWQSSKLFRTVPEMLVKSLPDLQGAIWRLAQRDQQFAQGGQVEIVDQRNS